MAQWLIKHQNGNFDFDQQPAGFKVVVSFENKFWLCDCAEMPNGEVVIEFNKYQDIKPNWFLYYGLPNGKKTIVDVFAGNVKLSEILDNRNRRAIMYSDEQLSMRLDIMKWLSLNVWIPDKQRVLGLDDAAVETLRSEVEALSDDISAKAYIQSNLYYDL